MKILLIIVSTLFVVNSALAGKATKDSKTVFGKKPAATKAMTMTEAIAKYDTYKDKKIVVTGKVHKVCEKKGCWMSVKDGLTDTRTMFKDYGFFVPKEILNKNVKLEGTIKRKEISVSMARHFLKDEGASKEEIAKVTEPKMTYQFEATGVEIIK